MTDRRSRYFTHGSVVNLAVANSKRSRHLTETLSSETSFQKPAVPLQKRWRNLCAPSWPETRTKGPKRPNLLTIEDYEVKLHLVNMFASWFLVSMCVIWIFGVQINSIEQPIKSNSVGSEHVSHRRTSALYDHFDHSFIILKHVQ